MPTDKKVTRKLRAILSADVKGYSLLMSDDEAYTVETLKAYRALMSGLIEEHSGRVVDSPGDNMLAEFSSAVDAVQCAVEIQKALKEKNEILPENKRLEFRIGVNVGDVIQDGDRIYGNGVNVAARIEGLADPGGVCISRNAYDHISDKLNLGYKYLGEHSVKNIKKPVRVYKLLMADEDAGKLIGERPKPLVKKLVWATAVLALIVIASVVWQVYQKMNEPEIEPAKIEKMAFPLPEKPSIAVLPFENLSDDAEQEYFCDGLSEEIITALSKSSQIFVIARNSSFKYKGKPVKVQQVAEELGVHYVLEGSVRKDKERIRITAQLIDAVKGIHLWAERYDRNLNDIFAVQDDITKQIIASLHVKLTIGEDARIIEKGTGSLDAYLLYLQARELHLQFSKDENIKSRQLLEQVISIDPEYGSAYSLMAASHMIDVWIQATDNPQISIKKAIALATKAKDYWDGSHDLLGFLYSMVGQLEKALVECKKSVDLYPNSSTSRAFYGIVLRAVGRYEEAITELEKSVRLDPFASSFSLRTLGFSYALAGKYDEAINIGRKSVKQSPEDIMAKLFLALSYGFAGRMEEAGLESKNILRLNPNFNLDSFVKQLTIQDDKIKKRIKKTLQLAGLPEYPPGKEPPEKPSIAVLPFDNLSDDPEQGYLADGLTDELIGDLAKIKDVKVISRNSTFTYKGKDIKIPDVAKELNVRYVLEGSVQRSGNKIRIRAQLIDGKTDHHVWSESYDGVMDDIFKLQDEITGKIVSELAVKLTEDESERIFDRGTDNVEAYEAYLKGQEHFNRLTGQNIIKAIEYYKKAAKIDPNFSRVYAGLALAHWIAVWHNFLRQMGIISSTEAFTFSLKARHYLELAMINPTYDAYNTAANMSLYRRRFDEAVSHAKKAVSIAPNESVTNLTMGYILASTGQESEALEFIIKAIKLDPTSLLELQLGNIGASHFLLGNYKNAIEPIQRCLTLNPGLNGYASFLAASYAFLGKQKKAEDAWKIFIDGFPEGIVPTTKLLYYTVPLKDQNVFDRYIEGLIKAGFKDDPSNYYKVYENNKLNGQQIQKLLFGKAISGNFMDTGWSMYRSMDGALESPNFFGGIDKGRSWIEGDTICNQFKSRFDGLIYCSDIYKNPEGDKKTLSEYLVLSDFGIFPFSIID